MLDSYWTPKSFQLLTDSFWRRKYFNREPGYIEEGLPSRCPDMTKNTVVQDVKSGHLVIYMYGSAFVSAVFHTISGS